jgi:hypothetical protein
VLGLVLLFAGLLWPYLSQIGLGRLPGDVVIERRNMTLYFPLMTCLFLGVPRAVGCQPVTGQWSLSSDIERPFEIVETLVDGRQCWTGTGLLSLCCGGLSVQRWTRDPSRQKTIGDL